MCWMRLRLLAYCVLHAHTVCFDPLVIRAELDVSALSLFSCLFWIIFDPWHWRSFFFNSFLAYPSRSSCVLTQLGQIHALTFRVMVFLAVFNRLSDRWCTELEIYGYVLAFDVCFFWSCPVYFAFYAVWLEQSSAFTVFRTFAEETAEYSRFACSRFNCVSFYSLEMDVWCMLWEGALCRMHLCMLLLLLLLLSMPSWKAVWIGTTAKRSRAQCGIVSRDWTATQTRWQFGTCNAAWFALTFCPNEYWLVVHCQLFWIVISESLSSVLLIVATSRPAHAAHSMHLFQWGANSPRRKIQENRTRVFACWNHVRFFFFCVCLLCYTRPLDPPLSFDLIEMMSFCWR